MFYESPPLLVKDCNFPCADCYCELDHPQRVPISKSAYDMFRLGGKLKITASINTDFCSASFSDEIDVLPNKCEIMWLKVDEGSGQPQSDYQEPCSTYYLYNQSFIQIAYGSTARDISGTDRNYYIYIKGQIECCYNYFAPSEYDCGVSFTEYGYFDVVPQQPNGNYTYFHGAYISLDDSTSLNLSFTPNL